MNRKTACISLKDNGMTTSDAVRLVLNILDFRDKNSTISPIEYCHKIINLGMRHIRIKEMSFIDGLPLYISTKTHLRENSLADIKYLARRLIREAPLFAICKFSEFSVSDCETWLAKTFTTPSQFNKGRAMLHGLFEFALRREWCERNPVKLVERRKVVEKEISPL